MTFMQTKKKKLFCLYTKKKMQDLQKVNFQLFFL